MDDYREKCLTHLKRTGNDTLKTWSSLQSKLTYDSVSKSFRTESIAKYKLTTINIRWEATTRVMVAKLTTLIHKIAIQLHLMVKSCTIRSFRSRRPVRKLLDNSRIPRSKGTIQWGLWSRNRLKTHPRTAAAEKKEEEEDNDNDDEESVLKYLGPHLYQGRLLSFEGQKAIFLVNKMSVVNTSMLYSCHGPTLYGG
jgi:hypothetical protein